MFEVTYSKPDMIKLGPIRTSKRELVDLLKAWLAISVAFGIAIGGGYLVFKSLDIFTLILISAIVVGTGFLCHELAHKIVAQKYHCWAEFRSFDNMLWLALAMSLFGFVFAAPGAVIIVGTVTKDRNGKISLAGPMTNIILAILFLGMGFFVTGTFLVMLANYGFFINVLLALFNLIPIGNFDGRKIWMWSHAVWISAMVAGGSLLVLSML